MFVFASAGITFLNENCGDALENVGIECLYFHPLELLSKRDLQRNRVSAAGVNENFPSSQRACLERIPEM